MSDYSTFENRWEITGKITLLTPLRIGAGQNAATYSLSETPVLQSYDAGTDTAEPYIPGSSLKGVLRSAVERIIRTFNEEISCISVDGQKKPCGKCISCSIFGSMVSGAMVRVHDAHLSEDVGFRNLLGDRPHCATSIRQNGNLYEIERTGQKSGRGGDKPKINLRMEEVVAANTSFDLSIKLDNAEMVDVGFLLLGLDEFNAKRCFLGGGSSRGHGFVEIEGIKVIEKSLDGMRIKEVLHDANKIRTTIKHYIEEEIEEINTEKNITRRDFDVYYNAYGDDMNEGHIVAKFTIETLTDFKMAGVDEVTVTNMGVPVIPGSTIKGWLKHTLIAQKLPASEIDDIFGSTKEGHSSRLIVSDAFPDTDFSEKKLIPKGKTLTMWMVFDNMDTKHVGMLKEILNKTAIITGNTSSGKKGRTEATHNKVRFIPAAVSAFKRKTYLL